MKNKINLVLLFLIILPLLFLLNGCGYDNNNSSSNNKVCVEVYIDSQKVDAIYTNSSLGYKINEPLKPEDITTNPNSEKYFYGWFVDSNFQTPLTEDCTFLTDGKIYGKWIDIYSNNFIYSVSEGKATITMFTNTHNSTAVVVPCYINSFPVISISDNAFANQTMLRNVIICNGIEYIGNSAFRGCNSMQTLQLPETIKEIGINAFKQCTLLSNIYLKNTEQMWQSKSKNYSVDNIIDTSNGLINPYYLTQSYTDYYWLNYILYKAVCKNIEKDNVEYYSEFTKTFNLKDATKNGYSFDGYYDNNTFQGQKITQIEYGTTHDSDLYAKFELIEYSINYFNTKNLEIITPNSYNVNSSDIYLQNLSTTGYEFKGWYSESSFVTQINCIRSEICQNINLYAKWELIEYNIEYISDYEFVNPNPLTYSIEDNITLSKANNLERYNFIGYYSDKELKKEIKNISSGNTGNITLYLKWEFSLTWISTPSEFLAIKNNLSGKYILKNSLSFYYYHNEDSPLGVFNGYLDGNGCSINDFCLSSGKTLALFNEISKTGKICNLYLNNRYDIDCNIVYDTISSLAGSNRGTIENVKTTISIDQNIKSKLVGGIVGSNSGNISNSYSYISINNSYSSSKSGGFIAENSGGIISNCYSTGLILNGFSSGDYYNYGCYIRVAGFIGDCTSGTINNCYSTCSVRASLSVSSVSSLSCIAAGFIATGNKTVKVYNSYSSGGAYASVQRLYSSSPSNLNMELKNLSAEAGSFACTSGIILNNCYYISEANASCSFGIYSNGGVIFNCGEQSSLNDIWQFISKNWDSDIWNLYLDKNPTLKH